MYQKLMEVFMSKKKNGNFNHKRRKKLRRKVARKDKNWEKVFVDLAVYEIYLNKQGGK